MAITTNSLNLTSQGVPYFNGTGVFTAPTLTNRGMIVGDTANAIKSLGVLTNGQLYIGSTGADPVAASILVGTGLSINGGAGTISLSVTGGGLAWSSIVANQTLAINNGYFTTAGTLSLALPASSSVGDHITVALNGGTSWTITQAAGQSIRVGTNITTVGAGGTLASASANGDCINLVCHTANTGWYAVNSFGNFTFV